MNTVASLLLVLFNALIEVWPMVAMNVVLAGINLFFIRRLLRDRHDETAYDVLEVGLGDAYLQHILRVHGDDIGRNFPASDGAEPSSGTARRSSSVRATRWSGWCWCATPRRAWPRSRWTT